VTISVLYNSRLTQQFTLKYKRYPEFNMMMMIIIIIIKIILIAMPKAE